MTDEQCYELPWPPSVNAYWRNVGNKVLISEKGRLYSTQVRIAVIKSRPNKPLPPKMLGRISVEIMANPPDIRARDLDNILKALFDSLTKAGVWKDDSQIDVLNVMRGPVIKHGRVKIIIKEL